MSRSITAEELTDFAKDGGSITMGAGRGAGGAKKGAGKKAGAPAQGVPTGSIPATVKPLSEMTAADRYKDQGGGLYGKGQNTPPEGHLKAALQAAGQIDRAAQAQPGAGGGRLRSGRHGDQRLGQRHEESAHRRHALG